MNWSTGGPRQFLLVNICILLPHKDINHKTRVWYLFDNSVSYAMYKNEIYHFCFKNKALETIPNRVFLLRLFNKFSKYLIFKNISDVKLPGESSLYLCSSLIGSKQSRKHTFNSEWISMTLKLTINPTFKISRRW